AGKGSTWEGGMREPAIFWGPGLIAPGLVTDIGSTMDLFTTFSKMAGIALPQDRIIDGLDLSATLLKKAPGPRKSIFYYRGRELYAVRLGDYKAHYITQGAYGQFGEREVHEVPLLFNLSHDASEKFDIAQEHPEILEEIDELVAIHKASLIKGEDQLADREP
ncbi:MAG: sulfatase-like hydrolase/transferase, partial [Eudoraea sp.]|nr:sulfatase-like hydrolase/transferase [Eudoraea sp.]